MNNTIIYTVTGCICLSLYVFWTYKKALLNFRAWALLMTTIYAGLVVKQTTNLLDEVPVNFLMILIFITTTVTIWRLWEITDKLVSKKLEKKDALVGRLVGMAMTAVSGGNDQKNIKKKIRKMLKKK